MGCMNQRVPVFMRASVEGVRADTFCWSELVRTSEINMGMPCKYSSMDIESLDKDELRRLVFKLCGVIY